MTLHRSLTVGTPVPQGSKSVTRTDTCAIEGCEKPRGWREWCKNHGWRWRKYGDPEAPLRKPGIDYQVAATCQVDGCDTRAHAHKYCSKHLTRWKKHGDPNHIEPIRGRPWKGDQPTWGAIHKRLSRKFGPAKTHPCVDCGETAREWSYLGGCPDELMEEVKGSTLRYSENLWLYVPRCVQCHRVNDKSWVTRQRTPDGRFKGRENT